METWKDINDFEGYYQVSDLGRIKRLPYTRLNKNGVEVNMKEKIIKQTIHEDKHNARVSLCVNGTKAFVAVGKLVAEAFVPNPYNLPEAQHKDGNLLNNRASNLVWGDASSRENRSRKAGKKAGVPEKPVNVIKNGVVVKQYPSRAEVIRAGYTKKVIEDNLKGIVKRGSKGCTFKHA